MIQKKDNSNLILVGMPASGKELIGERGVDGFIALENEINCGINPEQAVIATGGSAVYGQQAMEHFKEIGTIIYLETEFEALEKRLGNIRRRGVVLRKGQDLRALYDERVTLYRRYADIVITEKGLGIEDTLSEILEALQQ